MNIYLLDINDVMFVLRGCCQYLCREWDVPFVPVPAHEGDMFGLIDEEYDKILNKPDQSLLQVSDGDESDHPVDSTSWEVDDQVSLPEMDNLENRMDLTDDLLHMVFVALLRSFSCFCVFSLY